MSYLHHFFNCYNFYIGSNLWDEIPNSLCNDSVFKEKIIEKNYDYAALMRPYFERNPEHINDGEYEAIGLAYFLEMQNKLGYLIIDDRTPYNFVKRHFDHLENYLTGTIGFIGNCCCTEEDITPKDAIDLLNYIKRLVKEHNRPCSMDEKNYKKIIDPVIKRIRSWDDGGL